MYLDDVYSAGIDGSWIDASFHVALASDIQQETTYRLTYETEGDAPSRLSFENSGVDLVPDNVWSAGTLEYTTGIDDIGLSVRIACESLDIVERYRRLDNLIVEVL